MNIVFWSEEDGCGTTSGMVAIASVCSQLWDMKPVFIQVRHRENDFSKKLLISKTLAAREESSYIQPIKWKVMDLLKQAAEISDLTFVDCGCSRNELVDTILPQADVVVVTISQERQNLDAYFQKRHVFSGKVIYLVNQYQQDSIYNKKNLNRLYRLEEGELAVIPHNPFFRYACGKGKVERFIRKHIRCTASDSQFYFIQDLIQTSSMVLKAAGIYACNRESM